MKHVILFCLFVPLVNELTHRDLGTALNVGFMNGGVYLTS